MTDVPAMCVTCGKALTLPELRIARLAADGAVELQHERDGSRCGPVVVSALQQKAAETPVRRRRGPGGRGQLSRQACDANVRAVLESAAESLTQKEIADAMPWPATYSPESKRTAVSRSLARMIDARAVTRTGLGDGRVHESYRYAIVQRGAA